MRGLQTARLSGRAEIVQDSVLPSSGDLVFYLDGAHSPESIEACARWFSSAVREKTSKEVWGNGNVNIESEKMSKKVRFSGSVHERFSTSISNISHLQYFKLQILLFNCMDVRDPQSLLPILVDTCASSGIRHNFSAS